MPNQPSDSYLHTLEDFRRYALSGSIIWDRTTSGATRFTCGRSAKLDIGTASNDVAALRFFYVKTLKRPSMKEDLPIRTG